MSKRYRIPVWGSTNLKGLVRKKHRFPVKPDDLFVFLDNYKVTQVITISYSLRNRNVLLSARYAGEFLWDRIRDLGLDEKSCGGDIGKSYIRIYSVAPEIEEIAREFLLKDALPLMCEWLADAEKQTYNWRRQDHSVVFWIKGRSFFLSMDEPGW